MIRQSVFGRLGGYDDVNDADRLSLDPVMPWIVGGHAVTKQAASTSLPQEGMKFSTMGSGVLFESHKRDDSLGQSSC